MSAKQVYLGVRVKVTVKEMLERKRAREADKKRQKLQVSPAGLDLQELCTPAFPSPAGYPDPPAAFQQADPGRCGAPVLPPLLQHYAAPVSIQAQASDFGCVQPQFGDGMMPGFGYVNNNNSSSSSSSSGGFSYSTPLPDLTSSPQTWSQVPSPQADYGGMGSYSSNESLALYNHWDYYSASPQEFSSSASSSTSSSCYSSPTRLEQSQQLGLVSESYPSQQCSSQPGYPQPPFWPLQPEGFPPAPYPSYDPPDYQWAVSMKELSHSGFRAEFSAASPLCYDVL